MGSLHHSEEGLKISFSISIGKHRNRRRRVYTITSMGSVLNKPDNTVMSESVKIFVSETVLNKKVVVFSKTYCPYCKKVIQILQGYPIQPNDIEIIQIEKRPDCAEIQAHMKLVTGASSVPRVFINGQSIGGCDDTAKLHESGELRKMLEECKALTN